MSKKEHTKQLKESAKELLDGIGIDTPLEQKLISMIYGFVYGCFKNNQREKGGAI